MRTLFVCPGRQTIKYVFLAIAATLASWFLASSAVSTWFKVQAALAQTYPPTSLQAKYKVISFQTNGQSKQSESVFVLRSDGSEVEPRSVMAPDGKSYDQRIIINVQDSKRIFVDGITRSLTTMVLPDRDVEKYRARACDPGSEAGTILGHRVTKREISAGVDRMLETWIAPELGCVVLKQVLKQIDAKGVATPLLVKEAFEVSFGEPDPSLFVLPSWPERSPSQVAAEFARMFGVRGDPRADEGADRAYYANQVRRP